jgi:co-chaperonin GroES (HSP10)
MAPAWTSGDDVLWQTVGAPAKQALPANYKPAGSSVGLQVTQDRVLIRADREDKAPQQTASGLYVAQSLAAAVDGADSGESWFCGTIVQLGPLVRRFDVRDTVLDWLQELEQVGHDISPIELKALRARIRTLPKEHIDPLSVGDRVVFSWASGQQIAIGEDRYIMLRVDDILGIVEED